MPISSQPCIWGDQLATDTFVDCAGRDSVTVEYCCFRPAGRRSRMASSCICSYRHSSLQKGVSPRYMKMSLSRPRRLAQSAHAFSAGATGSHTGSASKKKKEAAMICCFPRNALCCWRFASARARSGFRPEGLGSAFGELRSGSYIWATGRAKLLLLARDGKTKQGSEALEPAHGLASGFPMQKHRNPIETSGLYQKTVCDATRRYHRDGKSVKLRNRNATTCAAFHREKERSKNSVLAPWPTDLKMDGKRRRNQILAIRPQALA
jgi:hypothetical protein